MQVLAASDVRVVGLSGESCLALPRVNAGLGRFWSKCFLLFRDDWLARPP